MQTIHETLDLARTLTAHHVEKAIVDGDGYDIHIGDHCTLSVYLGGPFRLHVGDLVRLTFGNIEAAIQAADTYETVMLAIREAAKASREAVTA